MEYEDNLIWVVGAKPLDEYRLELLFNNGRKGVFDCKPLMSGYELFRRLEDLEIFNNITLDGWTVTWADGSIDIAPEYLYEHCVFSYGNDVGILDHVAEDSF